jgi:hypothetical protein
MDESRWSRAVYTYLMAIVVNADETAPKRVDTVAYLLAYLSTCDYFTPRIGLKESTEFACAHCRQVDSRGEVLRGEGESLPSRRHSTFRALCNSSLLQIDE